MKLRIEVVDGLTENEVIIRCGLVDDTVSKLQSYIRSISAPKITFYKGAKELYLPLEEILFFETESEQVYAHTADDTFRVKHRLYELEKVLPHYFVRASKGAIVNTGKIYSIERNLTSSSQIKFSGTHKQMYVSRHYYSDLKNKINMNRN